MIINQIAKIVPRIAVFLFLLIVAAIMGNSLVQLKDFAHSALYGDMVIFGYILSWGSYAIFHRPFGYYSPPIFYPDTNMLPGTDGLELPALILSPLYYMFQNPILMMNAALLVSGFFALAAAYLCSRRLFSLPRAYCLILAVLFAVTTDRFYHGIGHLNLVWSGILPLIFMGVWLSLDQFRRRHLVLLALSLGSSVYLSVYFFVLGSLTAVLAFLCWVVCRGIKPSRPAMVGIAAAIACACLLAAPKIVVYKQASARSTQTRTSLAEAASYSATPKGYLLPVLPARYLSWYYKFSAPVPDQKQGPEDGQFIGYFLLLLTAAEALRLFCRAIKGKWDSFDRMSCFGIVTAVFLILCSFGPVYRIFSIHPYRLLYYSYLQFSGFYRVPARLAFIVQWIMILPIGILFLKVAPFIPRLNRNVALLPITALVLFEHIPATQPPHFDWEKFKVFGILDKQDPTLKQPVAFISSDMGLGASLSSTSSWRPMVNGWGGSPLSADFDKRTHGLAEFPTTASMAWLAENQVPWVMVTHPEARQRAASDERLELIATEQNVSLHKIRQPGAVAESYRAELSARQDYLRDRRAQTPASLNWPQTGFLVPVGGDEFKVENRPFPQVGAADKNYVSVLFHPPRSFIPGLFDRLEVEYVVLEGDSVHQTRLYWQTGNIPFGEKRAMAGTVSPLEEKGGTWKTTFDLHSNHEWMMDDDLRQLRLDFFSFNSLKPIKVEIKQVKLLRQQKVPPIEWL